MSRTATIRVELRGKDAEEHGMWVIDHVLDGGVLQDAIHEFAKDEDFKVRVHAVWVELANEES